jgi:hypothetical protein
MRYSNTTKNFYPEDFDYITLPDDIIFVTQADFNAAINREDGETLDVVNGQVVIIPKPSATVEELKLAKIAEISTAFTEAMAAGFMTTYNIKMDAELSNVQLLKSAYDLMVLLGHTTLPIVVDYNNTPHVDIPLHEVIAIIIEVAVNYQTQYAKKQTLRGLAMAAANKTELEAINW